MIIFDWFTVAFGESNLSDYENTGVLEECVCQEKSETRNFPSESVEHYL